MRIAALPPPAIQQSPLSQAAEVGTNVQFTLTATGWPMFYQWFKDGIAISNATQPTLTLNLVALTDAGHYSVLVSNAAGTALSSAAALAVRPHGAPIIRINGQLAVGTATNIGPATLTIEGTLSNTVTFVTLDGTPPSFSSRIYTALTGTT
jgi:Immunoglobulin domain